MGSFLTTTCLSFFHEGHGHTHAATGAHTFACGGSAFELQLGAQLAGERVDTGQREPWVALVPHEVPWKSPREQLVITLP